MIYVDDYILQQHMLVESSEYGLFGIGQPLELMFMNTGDFVVSTSSNKYPQCYNTNNHHQ